MLNLPLFLQSFSACNILHSSTYPYNFSPGKTFCTIKDRTVFITVKADASATTCANTDGNCVANAACDSGAGTCSCNSGYTNDATGVCTAGRFIHYFKPKRCPSASFLS